MKPWQPTRSILEETTIRSHPGRSKNIRVKLALDVNNTAVTKQRRREPKNAHEKHPKYPTLDDSKNDRTCIKIPTQNCGNLRINRIRNNWKTHLYLGYDQGHTHKQGQNTHRAKRTRGKQNIQQSQKRISSKRTWVYKGWPSRKRGQNPGGQRKENRKGKTNYYIPHRMTHESPADPHNQQTNETAIARTATSYLHHEDH